MNYSNNFIFFFRYQLGVVTTQNKKTIDFISTTKKQLFKTVTTLIPIDNKQIVKHAKEIHKDLLRLQKTIQDKNQFVLFNLKTKTPVRYTNQDLSEHDIIIFTNKQIAEENQEINEGILLIQELPLKFQLEVNNI